MNRKLILILFAFVLISKIAGADDRNKAFHSTSSAKITHYAPGVVYIQLKAGSSIGRTISSAGDVTLSVAPSSSFSRVSKQLGITQTVVFDPHASKDSISRAFGIDRMYCIYYSNRSIDPHAALLILEATGEVECGSVRYLFPESLETNDSLLSQQYALTNMNVFNAWNVTTGDTSIVIADVDCAINIDHEDLKDEIKYNWGEIGLDAHGHDKRSNGIDDDSDGYIDNWEGWDFCGDVNVGAGAMLQPNNNPRPRPPYLKGVGEPNHGTHTAGCILAEGNNRVGIAGVAFGCRLLAIKASGADNDNVSAGYEGIHYASTHGARIVNCSWGGPVFPSDTEFSNTFLYEAMASNVLVVAAAGNNSTVISGVSYPYSNTPDAANDWSYSYPADGPGVLSVGATDQNDAAAGFSDTGPSVSVWAPGADILSCDYEGSVADSNSLYSSESGTSFSSPLTAGVAGLIMSEYPTLPSQFVARQIIQTVDNVVNTSDRTDYWGRVDAVSAVGVAPWPGLIITQYAVNGVVSDSLGAVGIQQDLKVTFKDEVANGTNISVTLLPGLGYLAGAGIAKLGSMDTGTAASGVFQITRTGVYSQGTLPVRFFVTDGIRLADTLTLPIPLTTIPGFVQDIPGSFGTCIKRVSNSVAWAGFGIEEDVGAQFFLQAQFALESGESWQDTSALSEGSVPPYDIEAFDSLNAYFGTGPAAGAASVIFTNDGGQSFNSTDVSSFTPFVNSVHFFDPLNGILIGDPTSGSTQWGIGITTDGGNTWNPLAKPISTQGASVASWNNAAAWVGDNGWFGTNSKHIWHTTNRGQSWTAVSTAYQNSLSVAFDDDATHGLACFQSVSNNGTSGMTVTTDSGTTWVALTTLPVSGLTPAAVQFIPNSDVAILTSDMGVYSTSDFGASWYPIGIPVSFSTAGSELSISRGDSNFVVSINSAANGGIATYSAPLPGKILSGVSPWPSSALSLKVYPNPLYSSAVVSFTLPASEHVEMDLYDALGRKIATMLDGEYGAGSNQATLNGNGLKAGVYYVVIDAGNGGHVTSAVTLLP